MIKEINIEVLLGIYCSAHPIIKLPLGRIATQIPCDKLFFVVPACRELVLDGSINIFKLSML